MSNNFNCKKLCTLQKTKSRKVSVLKSKIVTIKMDKKQSGKNNNFWMTLNLLVGSEWKKNVSQEISDWLDSVEAKKIVTAISERKSTSNNTPTSTKSKGTSNIKRKAADLQRIQLPKVECSFNHPKIRSRLERLMGSNLVRLTDRKYMLQLHDRILEDYVHSMNKRIAAREAREREREKDLVLSGKIPLDQAPKEMANHPVLLINAYCEKLIAERRAKIKMHRVSIPLYLYVDDTPDPLPGLSIKDGHGLPGVEELVCIPSHVHLAFSDEEDVERGYMMPPEEIETKRKYESPEIQLLGEVETVEEMYRLADQIIGPLKTIQPSEDSKNAAA